MNQWKEGARDGLPICFGYFAVSFAFGIQAAESGLSPFQAVLMSLTNVTSAGQFASLSVIASSSAYLEMAFLQLVINMRYFLMSCALSQKISAKTRPIHRFFMSYGVTDEIFGLSVLRQGDLSPYYTYGLMSVAIPGWTFGTMFGVICGDILPTSIINALGIAIYGMFIAIILPPARQDRVVLRVVLAAMAMACVFQYLPALSGISSGMQVIVITLLVSGIAAVLFPREEETDAA